MLHFIINSILSISHLDSNIVGFVFKKEIIFKDNLAEITSISLENTLSVKQNMVSGEFIVSGEYKMSLDSSEVEPFSYQLPFEINLDERYVLENATVDIDDFYYEIVNDKVLSVNIEILIDKLEEKEIIDDIEKTPIEVIETVEEDKRCIEEETDNIENLSINTIVNELSDDKEVYKSYSVYIVREGDDVDTIMQKYNVSKEALDNYNDLKEIKTGDKIIIPCDV